MQNRIATNTEGLLSEANSVIAGANLHGVELKLKPGTATTIGDARDLAVKAQKDLEDARAEKRESVSIVASLMVEICIFARVLRELLKKTLGAKHSAAWKMLGFILTLMIPRRAADMEPMLEKQWKFLVENPDKESATHGITAAEAEVWYDKLKDARADLNEKEATVLALTRDRDAKFNALRTQIRGVCNELKTLIGPLDPRWKAFGFNMPGAEATPEVPVNLIAVLVGTNAISMKWDTAPRAEYYRVWKRVLGVDTELVAVGSPGDRDFTIEGLPAASQVEVAISAVNNGGESQKSEVRSVTTL